MSAKRGPNGLGAVIASLGLALLGAASCGTGDPFSAAPDVPSGGSSGGSSAGSGGSAAEGGTLSEGARPSSSEGGDSSAAGAGGKEPEPGSGGEGPLGCAPGTADCNGKPADGCEASLDASPHCGKCEQACSEPTGLCAKVAGQYTCTEAPGPSPTSQRLDLPCLAAVAGSPQLCKSVVGECPTGGKSVSYSFVMAGSAEQTFEVNLRLRGVLEPRVYTGGTDSGNHFYVGGTPQAPSNYNTVAITVSAPAKTYYLNAADAMGELYQVFPLDHTQVLPIQGGATVTLSLTDPDCALVRNCESFTGSCHPYVVAGVPPAPAGFDGQFLQLDLLKITPNP